MTDFDYKKYSLKQLKEWMHDAISSAEASPQEIYDVIKGVVEEQYHYFKHHTGRCYELLALLNGNGRGHIQAYDDYVKEVLSEREYYEGKDSSLSCDKDDTSLECKGAWNDFWEENYYPEEYERGKVKKWILPVQQIIEEGVDHYFVQFPDDLLDAENLKEGDKVEWVDQGDGSYLLRKV
jgi:hypothetical protein